MSMTAAQICALAAQIAKGPGMTSQAGQYLNMELEELVLIRNLKINRVTTTLTLGANTYGPFNLESDYLRTYDMFYPMPSTGAPGSYTGITIFLRPATMEQFDAEFKSPSTANYPYEFATDLSGLADNPATVGLLYIYPQSSGQLSVTHRYMVKRPDITSPESSSTVPWFPYSSYLVKKVATRMMEVTGDDRHDSFNMQCEEMLRPYLIQEGDEQQTVQNIRLDPRHFRGPNKLKPVKSYPF